MLEGRSGFRAFWRLWWYKTGLIIEILSLFIHLQSCLGACWERLGSSTWEHPTWVPGSQSRVLSPWHTHGARTLSVHIFSVIHLRLTCSKSSNTARDTGHGLLILLQTFYWFVLLFFSVIAKSNFCHLWRKNCILKTVSTACALSKCLWLNKVKTTTKALVLLEPFSGFFWNNITKKLKCGFPFHYWLH